MKPDLANLLSSKYPLTLGNTYLEVGDGWFLILWDLFEELHKLIGIKILQVKEKFGTLRVYVEGDIIGDETFEKAQELIRRAESRSARICDVCGYRGKHQDINGWWVTRCKDHETVYDD